MSDLKDTVERALAAYNRHDGAAFASYFGENGVLRVVATGEVNEGREQIQAGMEERWRALDYTLEPRGFYECGEDMWLEWTLTGTHVGELMGIPPTHRRVEGLLGCSHFTFGGRWVDLAGCRLLRLRDDAAPARIAAGARSGSTRLRRCPERRRQSQAIRPADVTRRLLQSCRHVY